jgi:hypothetical protein
LFAKKRRFRKIATQNYGSSAFFRKAEGHFFSFGAEGNGQELVGEEVLSKRFDG